MNAASANPRRSWDSIEARLDHRSLPSRIPRLAVSLIAFVTFAGAFTLLVVAFRPSSDQRFHAGSAAGTSPHVTATIPIGDSGSLSSGSLAAGDGSTWVSVQDTIPHLLRIDQETNNVVATISVDAALPYLVVADSGVWGAGHAGATLFLMRVDTQRNEVTSVLRGIGGPIDSGAGAIWATLPSGKHAASSIARIDPATNEVTDVIPLDGSAAQISVAGGFVWVLTDGADNEILQIDPVKHAIVNSVDVPGDGVAATLAAGEGALWVSTWDGSDSAVFKVDAQAGTLMQGPVRYRGNVVFAAGLGGIWSLGDQGAIYRLNASTLQTDVELRYRRTPARASTQPTAVLDAQSRTIWTGNYDGSLTRIDVG